MTLSTDLGSAYAAQMKAVLAHHLLPGRIVDLTHDLHPHGVEEAAFVVRAMAERFPAGSVHVVVVDPGVGGRRHPVAVACKDGSVLVGPDNGVLIPLAEALGGGRAYLIDPTRLGASARIGTTFDGRDIFAPAAARLARGVSPGDLGRPTTLVRPRAIPARRREGGGEGSIAHIDRFGNLVTDVPTAWVPTGVATVGVRLGRTRRQLPFVTSYEAGGRGRLVLLGSSFGSLELAVVEGRAVDRLGAGVGAPVRFLWRIPPPRPGRRNRK